MANIQDRSTAIHSALEEIGVTGELAIFMGGDHTTASIGRSGGVRLKLAFDIQDLPSSPLGRHDQDIQLMTGDRGGVGEGRAAGCESNLLEEFDQDNRPSRAIGRKPVARTSIHTRVAPTYFSGT